MAQPDPQSDNNDPAVNVIRSRINQLYGGEPNAKIEIEEVGSIKKSLSKHQRFMKELSESSKSLAEIQTEWHNYYQGLSDTEKHEVWQEFYDASDKISSLQKDQKDPKEIEHPPKKTHVYNDEAISPKPVKRESMAGLKDKVTHSARRKQLKKLSAAQHFKSLLFGLGLGSLVLFIIMFSFFNERFIAPFITPSKNVSSTPIIIDPNSTEAGPEDQVIIPKINVEVPVVYDVPTIQEADIQKGLESGVVHYITTPNPGEKGNSVIVGHSSNNLLNRGEYKFAFVLLNRLEVGDTFSITKNSKRYVYRIYDKKVVKPTDLNVLNDQGKEATVTLITCDPPGTAINRLIVVGEQISPEPAKNSISTAKAQGSQPTIVPGNAPSLWSRLTNWLTN